MRLTAKDYILDGATQPTVQTHTYYVGQPVIAYMVAMMTILVDHESCSLCGVAERAYMPLLGAGTFCCLLVLEVGEALEEVVLGMPRLGVLFALGL